MTKRKVQYSRCRIANCFYNRAAVINLQICFSYFLFSLAFVLSASLRLVGGSARTNGRVEVYHEGRWGTVCGRHFTEQDAIVVCKALGFKSVEDIKYNTEFGEGYGPVWLHRVDCYGDEKKFEYCGHFPWATGDCWHDEDVGVSCSGENRFFTIMSKNIFF